MSTSSHTLFNIDQSSSFQPLPVFTLTSGHIIKPAQWLLNNLTTRTVRIGIIKALLIQKYFVPFGLFQLVYSNITHTLRSGSVQQTAHFFVSVWFLESLCLLVLSVHLYSIPQQFHESHPLQCFYVSHNSVQLSNTKNYSIYIKPTSYHLYIASNITVFNNLMSLNKLQQTAVLPSVHSSQYQSSSQQSALTNLWPRLFILTALTDSRIVSNVPACLETTGCHPRGLTSH